MGYGRQGQAARARGSVAAEWPPSHFDVFPLSASTHCACVVFILFTVALMM